MSERFRPPAGPSPRKHLLSVGNLIPTKGHDLVIAAAGRAGLELPVVIVSHKSNPDEERRLQGIADRSGVTLDLRIGPDDDELVELYQSARVTLYLSIREPFGLVSTEAQACGSPVVVSDEGGLPESIVPGVTGWAVARDAAAWRPSGRLRRRRGGRPFRGRGGGQRRQLVVGRLLPAPEGHAARGGRIVRSLTVCARAGGTRPSVVSTHWPSRPRGVGST